MSKPAAPQKEARALLSDFPFQTALDTRWMDNDIYGHVNNVVYYSYFDTIVNRFLIERCKLDIHTGSTLGLMVSSQCNYFESIAFPDKLIGGFAVDKLGNSSVTYRLAIFKAQQNTAVAQGIMTHVFVDRQSKQAQKVDGLLRQTLQAMQS